MLQHYLVRVHKSHTSSHPPTPASLLEFNQSEDTSPKSSSSQKETPPQWKALHHSEKKDQLFGYIMGAELI